MVETTKRNYKMPHRLVVTVLDGEPEVKQLKETTSLNSYTTFGSHALMFPSETTKRNYKGRPQHRSCTVVDEVKQLKETTRQYHTVWHQHPPKYL